MDWDRQGVGPHTHNNKAIPQIRVDKIDRVDCNCEVGLPQSKSDSDLGGSGGSMPNITFALTDSDAGPDSAHQDGDNTTNRRPGNELNVYCSPRMSRRSFQDGDTSGEKGCWFEGFEPSRSLLSLRSSVQLGSTTSLDTNFTGRSLGLLSDDDSERTFLSDKPLCPNSPTRKLLRRFFSDPENGQDGDKNINRSSQSWTNLKDAQLGFVNMEGVVEKGFVREDGTTGGIDIQAVLDNLNEGDIGGDSANLVSSRHTQKTLSDGRIRQWLYDLNDEQQQQPVVDIPE